MRAKSFSTLALLCFLAGVFLPNAALAKDAAGNKCTCTYDDYSSDDVRLRSDVTEELGTDYPTDTASSCEAACRKAIPGPDLYKSYVFVAGTATEKATAERKAAELITPQPSVPIPGVVLSSPIAADGSIVSKFLPEYIAGVYRYALGAAAFFAIVMIMIGGVQYMLGSATGGEALGAARTRITNAVTGLILVLAAYTILYVVNPSLTSFEALKIENIKPAYFLLDTEIATSLAGCKDVSPVKKCSATTLTNPSGWKSKGTTLADAINTAASATGVDPILIAAHIQQETGGNPKYGGSIGPCGEIGPSQFMAYTYEAIVGGECCTNIVHKSYGITSADKSVCENTTSSWPPSSSDFPHCNTSICGTCAVASSACVSSFLTPEHLQNVIDATAKLIAYNLKKTGGAIGPAMCAYNGVGEAAAKYATSVTAIYKDFCKQSGGTN